MSFLGVIVDCNAANWGKLLENESNPAATFQVFIQSVLSFCGTHLLSSISNNLLVMGAGIEGPTPARLFSSSGPATDSALIDIEERILSAIGSTSSTSGSEGSAEVGESTRGASQQRKAIYVSSVATCICSHQRSRRENGGAAGGRIVVINLTHDLSAEQNLLMNLFFVAQQHSIKIDVASLNVAVPILQQACDITSGSHSVIQHPMQLVQFLMTRGVGGTAEAEEAFEAKVEDEVDYRATCHCHNQLVDSGYVCSVCLAVHCAPVPFCVVCNAFLGKRSSNVRRRGN